MPDESLDFFIVSSELGRGTLLSHEGHHVCTLWDSGSTLSTSHDDDVIVGVAVDRCRCRCRCRCVG